MFIGDLYGAIGSPVRLSRTVVIGRRQELVQRLLYVLTYFIRCSELLETHMLDSAEDEAIVMPGSLITTSLRKGEVEESDYVLVTVHKPSGDYLSQGTHSSLQSSTYTDTEVEHTTGDPPREEDEEDEEDEDSSESQGSRSSVLQTGHNQGTVPVSRTTEGAEPDEVRKASSSPLATEARVETVLRVGSASPREQVCVQDAETKGDLRLTVPSLPMTLSSSPFLTSDSTDCEADTGLDAITGSHPTKVLAPRLLGIPLEKKPPDKNLVAAMPVPGNTITGPMALNLTEEDKPATKVTFLIGDSMSPESDTESRRRRVDEDIRKHKMHLKDTHLLHMQQLRQHPQQPQQLHRGADSKTSNTTTSEDQTKQTKVPLALRRVCSNMPQWNPNCVDVFDEYFSLDNPVETRTIDDIPGQQKPSTVDSMQKDLLDPSGVTQHHVDHNFQSAVQGQGLGLCLDSGSKEVGSSRKGDTVLDVHRRCRCESTDSDTCCCRSSPAGQFKDLVLSIPVPQSGSSNSKEDQKRKLAPVNDWEIPRNESSDSALGDSESEETEDWQEEVLLPFPG